MQQEAVALPSAQLSSSFSTPAGGGDGLALGAALLPTSTPEAKATSGGIVIQKHDTSWFLKRKLKHVEENAEVL